MRYLRIVVLLVAGFAASQVAWGQGYPNKPVRIIVPFAAGSATDIVARLIADELKTAFNQAFIVDNKPGGSAIIGAEAAAKSPPDGYTLFVTTNTSHSANPFLFKKLPYDPIKDFTPIAGIMIIPVIVVVDPKLPINSMQELIAYTKANPGKVTFGYGNSIGQVVGASFAKAAGITVTPVPYKSSPQAMTDVMGGQVSVWRHRHGGGPIAGQGRQAPRDRRFERKALEPDAGPAGDFRNAGTGRIRRHRLGRDVRAGGNAQGDRRQTERRSAKGAGQAGDQGEDHAVRGGNAAEQFRATGRFRQGAARELGQTHQGRRHRAGVIANIMNLAFEEP